MGLILTRPFNKVFGLLTAMCLIGTFSISNLNAQACIEFKKASSLSFGADEALNAGDEITFDFYLTNCGTEDITEVVVDEFSAAFTGTGTMPPVPNIPGLVVKPGATKHFISTYVVTDADLAAGEVLSQGIVSYEMPDGTEHSKMSDSANILDDQGTDMDLTKQALPLNDHCPALACNDLINLSLDGDCEALVTVDMILEGVSDVLLIGYYITILDQQGNLIPGNMVTSEHLGQTLTANVISTCDGNTCWGNILVEDKLEPEIVCDCPPGEWMFNPDCSVECLDFDRVLNGQVGQPDISDNCGGVTAVLTGAHSTAGNDCGEWLITQTWTLYLENEYGTPENTGLNCNSEYYVYAIDFTGITGPDEVTFECSYNNTANYDTHPDNTGYPLLNGDPITSDNENTCNIIAYYDDLELPICVQGPGNTTCNSETTKIVRTWTVLNWCTGESEVFTQVIKIEDTEPPVIEAQDQIVSVDPWECAADVWLNPPTLLKDNCSQELEWYITSTNSGAIGVGTQHALGVPKGDWIFTIAAVDCCGNIATADINVSVVDQTPPVPIAHQDIIVGLTISGTGDGTGEPDEMAAGSAKIFKQNINNGSFDMCSNVHVEIRREREGCKDNHHTTYSNLIPNFCDPAYVSVDHDYGNEVAFCCFDVDYDGDGDGEPDGMVKVWMRVWDDANMDGMFGSYETVNGKCELLDNYNETWIYVKVENKLTPNITCPPDITIPCDWDYTDLNVTGSHVTAAVPCNSAEYDYTDWVDLNCGEGQIERNWYVIGFEDEVCTQYITVVNPDANTPLDVNCPGNGQTVYVDCDDHVIPEPWFSGNACSLTGITSSIDTFTIEDGACYKVIKKWTIIDWCSGETVDCEYVFARIDTEAPDIMCQDTCVAVNDYWDADNDGNYCELANNIGLRKSATDEGDCPSDWIKWIVQIDYWNDGTIDVERSSFYPHNSSNYIAPTQMGQDIIVILNRNAASAEWAIHRVKYKAFDGCGNLTQCEELVEVADKKAPTPYCVGISSALMADSELVELWASDFNIGSFDNCSSQDELYYTFAQIPPVLSRIDQVHYFDASGLRNASAYEGGYPVQKWDPATNSSATKFVGAEEWCGSNEIEISVWDQKLNTDYCLVELLIGGEVCDDFGGGGVPRASIAGELNTEDGTPINDVLVSNFSDQLNYPWELPVDGSYAFEDNLMYQNYDVSPFKDNGHLNGVSTLDVVLIQRHILGLQVLDSGYKLIAADVNNDEAVSGTDLVELRKLILGIYSSLPTNTSWRFADSGTPMSTTNPWPFAEKISLASLDTDMMDETFIGIKIGDVNNSVIASAASTAVDTRSSKNIELIINTLENGQVEIKAGNNFDNIYGYQFSLATTATLQNVTAGALNVSTENFGVFNNSVSTSFANATALSVEAGETLFTLTFDSKTDIALTDMVSSEAYGNNFEIFGIELRDGQSTNEYALMQNEPNPFSETTTITFTIPNSDNVTLTVFDLTGKVIKNMTSQFDRGTHTIQLSKDDLAASGVIYYQLESGDFTDTKKMIIIE